MHERSLLIKVWTIVILVLINKYTLVDTSKLLTPSSTLCLSIQVFWYPLLSKRLDKLQDSAFHKGPM